MNITNQTTHAVQQGTSEWLQLREQFNTASEAPSALGVGKYTTRSELLRRKSFGIGEEPDAAKQKLFVAGHEAEAKARPLAEEIIGGELFPTTVTAVVDGIKLLASLDGQDLLGDVIWESKLWNQALAEAVLASPDGSALPEHYKVQMDQELLVSGAKKCLFTCTDGTPERFVSCWYEASNDRFEALVSGWRQFLSDLDGYVPPAIAEPVKAEHMESLPAVSVRLNGALSVVGNLPNFAEALKSFIDRIPKKPNTDNEFATVDAACKSLKKAEEALDAAESGALASITDVEAMRRAVADCRKLARDTRLAAEKLVERRKQEVKEEAVAAARKALDAHIAKLNGEIAPMRLPEIVADFAGAIKGLRSIASMQDALDTTLAQAKIAADAQAMLVRANAAVFREKAEGLEFLFADLGQVIHKAPDDFALLVQARIDAHHAAEAKRLEAERERIRADEQARAARIEAARISAEQAAALNTQAQDSQQVLKAEPAMADATDRESPATPSPSVGSMGAGQAADAAPAADEPATLKLGTICDRLGFAVTSGFLADTLHIPHRATDKRAMLYRESDWRLICSQLASHISAVSELYSKA